MGSKSLGLPIVLLAALWGAVNTTIKFFEIINERRDMVFEMIDRCGLCVDEHTLGPLHIYFSNVVTLTIGNCIFLFLICYVVISIPKYMVVDDAQEFERMKRACMAIAVLPAFGFLGFVAGGVFDAYMIIQAL